MEEVRGGAVGESRWGLLSGQILPHISYRNNVFDVYLFCISAVMEFILCIYIL